LLEGGREYEPKQSHNEACAVLEVAAHAVGVLARACNAEVEVVEVQFADPAIEWLKDKQHETRRYAAVLVLRELALAAPTVLYDRRRPFFEDIWLVINDMKENIRYGTQRLSTATL
jgi:serine/threonine-protein kinase mTOR